MPAALFRVDLPGHGPSLARGGPGAACRLGLAWPGVRIAAATGEAKMPALCHIALASQVRPDQRGLGRKAGGGATGMAATTAPAPPAPAGG